MATLSQALARLDDFIVRKPHEWHIPGLALALTDRQHLLHLSTYHAEDETSVPITDDTLFEIGSIGKSFTSIVLQQCDAGRLNLQAPVRDYLPWFDVPSVYEPITVHHLLTHTAGISQGTALSPHGRYEVWALRALPSIPPQTDPTLVDNAEEYAGIYRTGDKTFHLVAEDGRLIMYTGEERVVLEQWDDNRFYVGHPDFALFLMQCGRNPANKVVEAFHGSAWYTNERYCDIEGFDYPAIWEAYTGHYQSHNPWLPHFRIVLRKGTLVLIYPEGDEEILVSLGNENFRIGKEEQAPERIGFDTVIQGEALRATLSNCHYFRSFTP